MNPNPVVESSRPNFKLIDTKKKRGKLRTRELWAGIHRTVDIEKPISKEEHLARVYTRENTPWVAKERALRPVFEIRKD